MRRLIAIAVLVLASACGGFDDQPFKVGVVTGKLNGAVDTKRAWVAVFGHPELISLVSGDGSFRIPNVPVGTAELIGIVSPSTTLRTSVAVTGGSLTELGPVLPQRAAELEVRVMARGGQKLSGGRVDLAGTPLVNLAVDEDGDLDIGAVPIGCYDLAATVPGMGARQERRTCMTEGEHLLVDYALPDPNGTEGLEGCAVTGCLAGLTCLDNGECE